MNISNTDRILIVAPHPDDESIGCGGLLSKYGSQCDILVLSDGRKGYRSTDPVDENELVKIREDELRRAAAIASVNNVRFLKIHDGTVGENKDIIMQYDITPYSLIFVPNRWERHRDHCVVPGLFMKMKRTQHAKARLYEYEVWSPLAAPTDSIDITEVIDTKLQMVAQYESQTKYVDYCTMALSLSRYRGAGFQSGYAEVFSYFPYRTCLKKIYDLLPNKVRAVVQHIKQAVVKRAKE